MKQCVFSYAVLIIFLMAPAIGFGQTAAKIHSLQSVLEQLYNEMIPLCSRLIDVGRGIAGFAAIWYIGIRVWGHIARAEPVDVYPLLRPFVLGFAVLIFPSVIGLINGILTPTVAGTSAMVTDSDKAVLVLLKKKEDAIKTTAYWKMYIGEDGSGDRDRWYQYNYGDKSEGMLETVSNDLKFAMAKASYNFRNAIKQWMSEVLQICFEAAALCINTLRTFYLIVLAILGPLVFGLAVFDGFQHTLTAWMARYVNVFLWLPVANIFGGILSKIQEQMLQLDLQQIATGGDTFFSTSDSAYLVFMIIGIVGYFTVPSVANHIVHAGGGNALLYKVSTMVASSARTSTLGTQAAGASMIKAAGSGVASMVGPGMAIGTAAAQYFRDKLKGGGDVSQDEKP